MKANLSSVACGTSRGPCAACAAQKRKSLLSVAAAACALTIDLARARKRSSSNVQPRCWSACEHVWLLFVPSAGRERYGAPCRSGGLLWSCSHRSTIGVLPHSPAPHMSMSLQ